MTQDGEKQIKLEERQKFYHLSLLSFYFLASLEVIVLYVTISLLDPWGYYPELIQFLLCAALLGLISVWLVKGYLSKTGLKRNAKGMFGVFAFTLVSCFASGMIAHIKPYESDVTRRLEVAFFPPFLSEEIPILYQIKIIPPAYTEYKALQKDFSSAIEEDGLKEEGFGALNPVAQGSQMFIYLQHAHYRPILYLGDEQIAFKKDGDAYKAEANIGLVTGWKIAIGSKAIGTGPIILIEDYKPEIEEFKSAQSKIKNLNYFKINISDDYNIASSYIKVSDEITSYEEKYDSPIGNVISFKGDFYLDLTASHFAGQKAMITFYALDEAGNETTHILQDIQITKKRFNDSTAQLISKIRKDLIAKPEAYLTYASEIKALSMSAGLSEKLGAAQPMYHMALRSAYWRIKGKISYKSHHLDQAEQRKRDLKSAEQLLWDVAILLEDGAASVKKLPFIQSLNEVKMALVRKDKLSDVRDRLVLAHRNYVKYLRAVSHYGRHGNNKPKALDVLKPTYNAILKNIHDGFYEDAIRLNNYVLGDALRPDNKLNSSKNYAGFIALLEGKKLLKELTNIQKTLLRYSTNALKEDKVYKNNELNIASKDYVRIYPEYLNDIKEWTKTQKKLGSSLNSLERSFKILKATSDLNFVSSRDLLAEIEVHLTSKNIKQAIVGQKNLIKNLDKYIEEISKIIEQEEDF